MKQVLAIAAGTPRVDDQTILALQFSPNGPVTTN